VWDFNCLRILSATGVSPWVSTLFDYSSAPAITLTTVIELAGVINAVFTSPMLLATKYGSNAELDKVAQQRAADQKANSEKSKPQGDKALSKNYPSGDFPGQGQEPWWNFNFCGFLACEAQAGTDDEGGGRTRATPRYGVIQKVPDKPTGRLTHVWKNRRLFKNWIHAEQSAKRIGNPLTADEANRVIQQAKELGVTKFDFNKAGLQGLEKTGHWAGVPHFKIEGTHIPVEIGFQAPF